MMRTRRIVLPVWKLWLMNQPFRVLRAAARGFGPGIGNLLRAGVGNLRLHLLDADRLRWLAAKLVSLQTKPRRD